MHSNPTKPRTTERSAAWMRGYSEARRDAANAVEAAGNYDLANEVRRMKPRPGVKPKET